MRIKTLLTALAAAVLLGGCALTQQQPTVVAGPDKTVRVAGYGATSKDQDLSMAQRRLLGMRASKLDALRNLVETVYGLDINGQTTVGAMAVRNDSFRAYLDAYIRGARVVSVTPLDDGIFETVVELSVDDRVYDCAYNPNGGGCVVAKSGTTAALPASNGGANYGAPNVRYYSNGVD